MRPCGQIPNTVWLSSFVDLVGGWPRERSMRQRGWRHKEEGGQPDEDRKDNNPQPEVLPGGPF